MTLKEILNRVASVRGVVIHNGIILDESATFNFYHIKPNDNLIVLPAGLIGSDLHDWIKASDDVADFKRRVDLATNWEFRRSMARLKDLTEWRLDSRPRQFRQRSASFQAWLDHPKKSSQPPLTLKYDRPDGPIDEPLPCAWKSG
jgi:hypothetical protein